jgi:hypothetical protein
MTVIKWKRITWYWDKEDNTELIVKSKPTLLLRIFSLSVWGFVCACVYTCACACVRVNTAPTGSILPTVCLIVIIQIHRHKQQNGGLDPYPSVRDGWRPGQEWGNNIKEVGEENMVRVVGQGTDKSWTPMNNMLYLETAQQNNWAL